jgi:hypothetical protein
MWQKHKVHEDRKVDPYRLRKVNSVLHERSQSSFCVTMPLSPSPLFSALPTTAKIYASCDLCTSRHSFAIYDKVGVERLGLVVCHRLSR